MKNWLKNLFSTTQETAQPDLLALQKEMQTLRVDLDERQQTIDRLKQEVERLRARETQLVEETTNTRLETLFGDLAGPAAQILTQADLLENQGKPVQTRDVLTVARRMLRVLERQGITFEGTIGQQVAFDPNRHTPMGSDGTPRAGQMVTVRFCGVLYRGKMIHKGVVEQKVGDWNAGSVSC